MATIVNSIGTAARDYSTPQAWEDARPADIVAAGNSYVGEMYNDSEFTSSLLVSGITTDATHTLTLRCAAGQSFRDHATRATNRLAYDQSKGAGIRSTAAYSIVVQCDVPNVTIDGIQVINTASPSIALLFSSAAVGSTAQNCILQSKPAAGSYAVRLADSSQKLVNSVVVVDTAATAMGGILESAARAVNCTVVRPSNYAAAGVAFTSAYGTAVVRNCAIFGFNAASVGTYAADGHNVTDFTSAPGSTGNLVSKAYANQFEQSSNAGGVEDYRLKTGSDCINAGVTDATNVPSATDIIGTARPQGTAWDVGAWEVSAGAPSGDGVGSASGTSAVTGTGASTTTGVGSAAGTSTASAVGQAGGTSVGGVGSASGTSTASAVGTSTNVAVGGASGASTASGVGAGTVAAIGGATGTSIATGIAPSIAQGVGSASGSSTAMAVSADQTGIFGGVPFFHSEYANKYRRKKAEEESTALTEVEPQTEPLVKAVESAIVKVAKKIDLTETKAKATLALKAELKRQEIAYEKLYAKQLEEQRNALLIQELQDLIQQDLEEQDEEEAMLLLM